MNTGTLLAIQLDPDTGASLALTRDDAGQHWLELANGEETIEARVTPGLAHKLQASMLRLTDDGTPRAVAAMEAWADA